MSLLDQLRQVLVANDLVILVSAEDGILPAESEKAASEDAFIQKLVLAEEIQGAIRDRRSREDQIELAHGSKLVKRLAAFRLRILDLAAFIADDHVRLPLDDYVVQSPAAFVIDHDHLKAAARHMPDGICLFPAVPIEHHDGVREGCELIEFLTPHFNDGLRRYHQHSLDLALLEEHTGDRDRSNRFSGSHVH